MSTPNPNMGNKNTHSQPTNEDQKILNEIDGLMKEGDQLFAAKKLQDAYAKYEQIKGMKNIHSASQEINDKFYKKQAEACYEMAKILKLCDNNPANEFYHRKLLAEAGLYLKTAKDEYDYTYSIGDQPDPIDPKISKTFTPSFNRTNAIDDSDQKILNDIAQLQKEAKELLMKEKRDEAYRQFSQILKQEGKGSKTIEDKVNAAIKEAYIHMISINEWYIENATHVKKHTTLLESNCVLAKNFGYMHTRTESSLKHQPSYDLRDFMKN